MGGLRRVFGAVSLAGATMAGVGVAALATAPPSAALPMCTDSWQGPVSGTTNWNAASTNWSTGFPTSSSVVCINLAGTYTVLLTASESINTLELGGGATGTQTLDTSGSAGSVVLTLAAASTVSSNGFLTIDPTSSGYVQLAGAGGVTVASGGALATSGPTGSDIAYIRTPVTNQTGGTVTIGAPTTNQDSETLTSNSGTFTVASTGNLALSGSSTFTDSAGTLTVTGTFSESTGTFTQSGGTVSGTVDLSGSATLADSAGTGAFLFTGTGTVTGTIPAGQSVTGSGSAGSITLTVTGVTVDGTLAAAPTTAGYVILSSTGTGVTVASGGTLSTSGPTGSDIAYIRTPVTNQPGGTVTIGAPTTDQDSGTLTTNKGTFTVASTGNLALSGSSTFTDSAGTLTVTGTFSESTGTFTQSGATVSGTVDLSGNATLADSTGTGTFAFTTGGTVTGTIPSGQSVTASGSAGSMTLTVTGVTVDGSLGVDPTSAGYVILSGTGLTVASGGTLSTSGPSGSDIAYIRTPVTNQTGGTVTIGAPSTNQDQGTATSNAGTLTVTDTGELTLSGSSTVTNTGTLDVTVNGPAGTGGISGPGVTITGSTLAVTTVGSPAVNTVFTPIGGPVTGTFATLSFGPDAYAVAYPSGAVQLTTKAPFTLSPTAFSAKENISTGTVQLASIGNATAGTGTYSATVNWGDGTGTGPATVNITGSTGTVTGSHTFTTPGSYTVTTTLANTDGTTLVTTESVTVTGPTVTGFSVTAIARGATIKTKITGTGFDSSAVVTVSNAGVTVDKVKFKSATLLKLKLTASGSAPLGKFNVTITQDDGTVTVIKAIQVTA